MKSVIKRLVDVSRMRFRPGLRLLLTFIPLAVLICLGSYFYYHLELRHTHDQHARTEYATVMAGVISLDRSLQHATRDLLDLYERIDFREMLDNPNEKTIHTVAVDWISFSGIKEVYHKIRWIDETGNERLRVNYLVPEPLRVPKAELQDRKDRYFFADTFKLKKGEIYVSPFDLNIEHDAIEVPHVPTIRLGLPVFDSHGKKRGILMINLFASDMLRRFEQASSLLSHRIWLVNQDGYWLKGESAGDEFAFMFQQSDRNMRSRYPEAWKVIRHEDSGQFLTEEGLWSFETLHPLEGRHKSSTGSARIFSPSRAQVDTSGYQWKIISLMPLENYNTGAPYFFHKYIGVTLAVLLISFVFSLLLVRVQHARNILLNNLEEMVEARTEALQKLNTDLVRSEARIRSLFENIPDLIWLKDPDGVYLGCNAAYEKHLGLAEHDIVGKTDFELQHPEFADKFRETDTQVLATGSSQTLEMWYISSVNKRALFEVIKVLVRTVSNEIVGVLGIARDITERRETQERLELSALVFKNSSESIQITNAHNEIIAVNPAFERLTGYTQEELLGKNPNIVSSGRQEKAFYKALWESVNATGFWQGELWNRKKNGELYAAWLTINAVYNEDGTVRNYIELCTDFTKEKEAEALIWRQANFDFLTGLPNRNMFMDRLRQEILKANRTGSRLALLVVGLDNFKDVNDAYGYDMGDNLLMETAQRISKSVREIDVVSREAGDEFGIILTELEDINDAATTARQLLQLMATPFKLHNELAYITASIGVAFYPDDAQDNESLLRNADHAMHIAKDSGRNRISYFRPSMEEASRRRIALINDLRDAVENGQFEVTYQPIVELATGMIHKAESLIRWHHPVRGIVRPTEFIPLAEETGLIFAISAWAFREVIRQVAVWREQYYPDFQISFNMSPVEFHDDNDETKNGLFDVLRKNTLPGKGVVVEITEGLLLISNENVVQKLARFHQEGMEVALDDFGTGYSSLAYLKKFDIDYLKIDQSFISELETESRDVALTEAIIVMGHKLGMKVIAEGVQTQAQFALLNQAGCDYGQGYLFSEPVSATEFEKLLRSHNIRHE